MRIARCLTDHGPASSIFEGEEALPLPGAPALEQDATSGAHNVFAPVSSISRITTLLPGDIIAFGPPAGVGPLAPGDVVAITIEGIGTLINPVAAPLPQISGTA